MKPISAIIDKIWWELLASDTLGGRIDYWEPSVVISQEGSGTSEVRSPSPAPGQHSVHTNIDLYGDRVQVSRCDLSVAAEPHADELMRL